MMELTLSGITKKYGSKAALNNVSLTLTKGIYGLLGPNGAGKSTMMNIICTNLAPNSGEVRWNGDEIEKLGAAYRSCLGFAPQQQGLYDSFTGRRFLSYMATLKAIPKSLQKGEIQRVLDYVNLSDVANRAIGTYSGGMKQRILIAQAVLGDPQIVVLDEPTAGLDPKERIRVREKVRELAYDKIILFSTHVVSDIQSIAKEIILIKDGEIVDIGSVEALCRKYGADNLEQVYLDIFGEEEDHNDEAHRI